MNRLAVAGLACAFLAARAAAAQCGTDPTSQFNRLTVTPTAVTFATPTVAQFDAGLTATQQYVVNVQPIARDRNRPWYLCLSAEAPVFPGTTGTVKPSGDLEWSADGATWAAVTLTPSSISPTYVGDRQINVRVRVRLRYTDAPGTYGPLPLRFWAAH